MGTCTEDRSKSVSNDSDVSKLTLVSGGDDVGDDDNLPDLQTVSNYDSNSTEVRGDSCLG